MANPWKEAAESMLQAGMSGVGSTNKSFYPSKEQVDQYNYGQASWDAQKWNRPSFQELGNTDKGPWLYSDVGEMINPNVAERQYGLNAYPGAASNWANIYNQGDYLFDSPKDMRDTMKWARAKDLLYSTKPSWEGYGMYDTLDSPSIMDELYGASEVSEDFIDQHFRSKEEQMEDAGTFEAMQMERYARQNPFLIEDDGGWTYRDPMEIAYGYGQNLGDQYRYSPDRQPGISDINDPLQYLPSDRQPGLNDYLAGSPPPGAVDVTPSDLREGLTYPEGIGDFLQGTTILNKSWEETVATAGENDFVFLDPPYTREFTEYSSGNDFGRQDHIDLANYFKTTKSKCMIIINKDEFTEELYKGYIKEEYDFTYSVKYRDRFSEEDASTLHFVATNY